MTKKEKLEAFQKLRILVNEYLTADKTVVWGYQGLCGVISGHVGWRASQYFTRLLQREARKMGKGPLHMGFLWRRGCKGPRLRWIDENIKRLSK